MKNKFLSGALTGLVALVIGCSPFSSGKVDYHPAKEGKIEGLSVTISYNNDECWRVIRISSLDGKYVEAEDYITDCDKKFNVISHEGSLNVGHPLRKYTSFEVLEKVYQKIKSQPENEIGGVK